MSKENIIVGLDIGTTKIGCIIAELDADRNAKIVGVGTSRSEGLRRGVVVNLEKTVVSIGRAVEEAELMAGVEVRNVYAGIAGDHIRSINSHGVIAVSRGGVEITRADINRVIDAAKAVAIPMDREILHILPQEFTVDDQRGIKDPTGMAGVRLEVDVHIVTGAVSSAQNLVKAIQKAGYQVRDLVLEPLASSYGALTDDERELGVALVDIGGGTTDVAIFNEGAIRHTAVIGLGGNSVTNDLAIGLRTPAKDAERIKERYGAAMARLVEADEEVVVPRVAGQGERRVGRRTIASIIQPRMEEILALVRDDIRKTKWHDRIPAGLVLTGGASALPGTAELAEHTFDLPVRIGYPLGVTGLMDSVDDPRFATGVGLVLYAKDRNKEELSFSGRDDEGLWNRVLDRMKEWFRDFF
ncbi:MAG TPA: cell division protein FtsA [Gemmatimonadota bacterium]|nr:cell division protein FtsA [Gemmatimonadota bacterium]